MVTFESLREHCIGEGCNFEELSEGVYLVKNCINAECCFVEDLEFYSSSYLAHIFYELNIDPIQEVEDSIHVYYTFRDRTLTEAHAEEE